MALKVLSVSPKFEAVVNIVNLLWLALTTEAEAAVVAAVVPPMVVSSHGGQSIVGLEYEEDLFFFPLAFVLGGL